MQFSDGFRVDPHLSQCDRRAEGGAVVRRVAFRKMVVFLESEKKNGVKRSVEKRSVYSRLTSAPTSFLATAVVVWNLSK